MAKDDPKPYRDDEQATLDRAGELERQLDAAADEKERIAIQAQVAATWARQYDAEVHRGSIERVVPKPRWAPRPARRDPRYAPDQRAIGWMAVALLIIAAVGAGVAFTHRPPAEPPVDYPTCAKGEVNCSPL